jgi:hypothetical protein
MIVVTTPPTIPNTNTMSNSSAGCIGTAGGIITTGGMIIFREYELELLLDEWDEVELELCEELLEDDEEAEELLEEDEELEEELEDLDEELLLLLEELEEELEEELDDDTELEEELEDELEDELLETELELLLLLEELDEELDDELEELDEELDEELEELAELEEELETGIHLLALYLFSRTLIEMGSVPLHMCSSIGNAPRVQHSIQLSSFLATSENVFPLQLLLVVKDPIPHPVSVPVPHCWHTFSVSFPLHCFWMYSPFLQLGHCVHPVVWLKPMDSPLHWFRST